MCTRRQRESNGAATWNGPHDHSSIEKDPPKKAPKIKTTYVPKRDESSVLSSVVTQVLRGGRVGLQDVLHVAQQLHICERGKRQQETEILAKKKTRTRCEKL